MVTFKSVPVDFLSPLDKSINHAGSDFVKYRPDQLGQGGGNLAECIVFGRIAGANAAAEDQRPNA